MKRSKNKFTQRPPIQVGEVEIQPDGKMLIISQINAPDFCGEWRIMPSIKDGGQIYCSGVLSVSSGNQAEAQQFEVRWRSWIYRECGLKFKAAMQRRRLTS